ncbi:hypothetical protein V6N13_125039 [Hibiscus sabdariffa]
MEPLRKQRNPDLIKDPNIFLATSISSDEMWKYERSDQPRQVKDYTRSSSYKKLYSCCFDQRPRIHSGRKFKYLPRHLPRQARKIQQGVRYDQHIFPNTIGPGARQTKA